MSAVNYSWVPVLGALFMTLATIGMGLWATRRAKTASDFFVAGRSVSVFWNASAISGEYLSAPPPSWAIAGHGDVRNGYDALWYPVCYACGLSVPAAVHRRARCEALRRVHDPGLRRGPLRQPRVFRKIAVVFVLFIGFFYTMPQMKGAGVTLGAILDWPYWAGIAIVGVVITFNVAFGGMKGITLVQAFQYWAKMFAISAPIFVLAAVFGHYPGNLQKIAADPATKPQVESAWGVEVAGSGPVVPAAKSAAAPLQLPSNATWIAPFGPMTSKHGYPLLYTYSLIIALICGTAGLPHILVRFYTNPDGRAAKRTTLWVMVMLGAFYVFPPIWGTLGRILEPVHYVKGTTDRIVITLPRLHPRPLVGAILGAITAAGAFAAFMSTFSGLLVSMSGALAHDIYGKILRPGASPESRMAMFKVAAVIIGLASMGLGLLVESFDIAMMVGWAFAIAACSYFPLLLLGSWWRGLTKFGAGTGMLGGGVLALGAIVTSMLLDKKILTFPVSPLARSLMEQPAIWGVPLSIGLMIVVSLMTQASVPPDVDLKMLRLHAPEEMGLSKNYIEH